MQVKYEKTGTFKVTFYSYSGIVTLAENVEKDEAKEVIKSRLRRAKRLGLPVEKIDKGSWEIQTPDDAVMVSDEEGTLTVTAHTRCYRRILGRKVYLS